MDGIFNINKPAGKTSFGVVALVRRLSGERRVGHAGTLDPAATGVLPVAVGQGTRVIEFLVGTTKAYRAEIELGIATDTYDADGRVVRRGDPSAVDEERLEAALASFRGLIWQTPPMYSAVKYRGRPLYKLARAGITIERQSRMAEVHDLKLVEWQPPVVVVEVVCGKGTYIRSLADDLGQMLGCGAYLKSLVRLKCGIFDIGDAVTLSRLEDAFLHGYWQQFIHPVDSVLLNYRAVVVGAAAEDSIRSGRPLDLADVSVVDGKGCPEDWPAAGNYCRAYALDGDFLGVLRFNSGSRQWQPRKVFVQPGS